MKNIITHINFSNIFSLKAGMVVGRAFGIHKAMDHFVGKQVRGAIKICFGNVMKTYGFRIMKEGKREGNCAGQERERKDTGYSSGTFVHRVIRVN